MPPIFFFGKSNCTSADKLYEKTLIGSSFLNSKLTDRIYLKQRSLYITSDTAVLYGVFFPFYAVLKALIGILGHFREVCCYGAWKQLVTPREIDNIDRGSANVRHPSKW
jgi:hypothetical protein